MTRLPVRPLPKAKADIAAAFAYLNQRRPASGREFVEMLDEAIQGIPDFPRGAPCFRGDRR